MNRDKQIEKLTRVICQSNRDGICGYDGKPCNFECGSYQLATKVYTAGYRKASEVAREISGMLREDLRGFVDGDYLERLLTIYEKKYESEKDK